MPFANLLWPSLLYQHGTVTVLSIVVALAVEGFFLWRVTQFSFTRVLLSAVVMNLVSTLIGLAAMPVLEGWIVDVSGSSLPVLLTWSGFSGVFWISSLVLLALVDAGIEGTVVRLLFKSPMPIGGYLLLAIGNMIGLAFGVMLHLVLAMARGA